MRALIALSVPALMLGLAGPAHAAFHFAHISEVLVSHGGEATRQFVEIEMDAGGQTIVENSVLAAFDSAGDLIGDLLVVPGNISNSGSGLKWLMATAEFEATTGLAPDFTFPAGLPLGGGMVCWGAPGSVPPDPGTWDHGDPANYVDCLAYGTYTGPTHPGSGTPTPLLAEGHSLQRISDTDDNATDFACGDPADPVNNDAETADVAATEPCAAIALCGDGIVQAGEDCDDGNTSDGDECPGSCILAAPPTKADQACVNEVNKRFAGVLKARGKVASKCLKYFARGKESDFDLCSTGDARGKVEKARAKTVGGEQKKCGETLFAIGYQGADAANDAANGQASAAISDLFGAPANPASGAEKDIASCQAEVVRSLTKLEDALAKALNKAKKDALKGKKVSQAQTAGQLAAALVPAFADAKVTGLASRAEAKIPGRCPDGDLTASFPGRCDATSAASLASCTAQRARCRVCLAIEAADGLDLDCDSLSGAPCPGET
jgi:cysteine-rich repeat protein